MEDLNKTQLVLLCLLLSFVTSIATGIITVSLLQEAPKTITQTVNRVVQETVEKVVPTPSGGENKQTTVIVKEEDLIISSIEKSTKGIVRIVESTPSGFPTTTFSSLGVVVSKDGLIASDRTNYKNGADYLAVFSDGKTYPVVAVSLSEGGGIIIFKANKNVTDLYSFESVAFETNSLKLGQTVIAIGGKERNTVSIGRVTDLLVNTGIVKTDVTAKDNTSGALLLNLNGEISGIRITSIENSSTDFLSSATIKAELSKVPKQ